MTAFKVGDLAWAKMKGYTPWPALVVPPVDGVKQPKSKEPMYYVKFFGSNDFAWIAQSNLFPFEENKNEYMKKNSNLPFQAAVTAIMDYISNNSQRGKSHPPKINMDSSKTNGVLPPKKSMTPNKKFNYTKEQVRKSTPSKKKSSVGKMDHKKRRLSESSSASSTSIKKAKSTVDRFGPLLANTPPNTSGSSVLNYEFSHYTEITKASGLLTRPVIDRPVTPPMNLDEVSDTLSKKNISPTDLSIGFLGLGKMGRGIVKNLIHSKHKVTIWNRSPDKCADFVLAGAVKAQTPGDVVHASQITFSCVSDPQAAKELIFCTYGVLEAMQEDKGYVELTSIDPETSRDIAEAITAKKGRYLEAPILGSKKPAEDGTLIILAAGDRELYKSCRSCFQAIGKDAFYLGDVGNASKMNLVINMIMGTTYSLLAEALALAERAGVSRKDLLEILDLGSLKCPAILEQGRAMMEGLFNATNMPLQHMQRNLHLALSIADDVDQPLPMTSTANEVFKHAKRMGYGLHDVTAVYMSARF